MSDLHFSRHFHSRHELLTKNNRKSTLSIPEHVSIRSIRHFGSTPINIHPIQTPPQIATTHHQCLTLPHQQSQYSDDTVGHQGQTQNPWARAKVENGPIHHQRPSRSPPVPSLDKNFSDNHHHSKRTRWPPGRWRRRNGDWSLELWKSALQENQSLPVQQHRIQPVDCQDE